MQQALMKFDPATGEENPYPSHAQQWRDYHGKAAWLFNPWNGKRRSSADVGSDIFGLLIHVSGEPMLAFPEWISVKDRLPPDDPDLQIRARSEGVEFDEWAHFVHRYPSTYSHWQPLPLPPQEEA